MFTACMLEQGSLTTSSFVRNDLIIPFSCLWCKVNHIFSAPVTPTILFWLFFFVHSEPKRAMGFYVVVFACPSALEFSLTQLLLKNLI